MRIYILFPLLIEIRCHVISFILNILHYLSFLLSIVSTVDKILPNKMQQQQEQTRKNTILVEGNIGAGKTTSLQHIAQYTNVQIIFEPLDKWTNLNGINLLQRLYQNPEKWSYTFQNYALLTNFENHLTMCEKDIKFIERSIYSGRYCFAEALVSDGKIEPESFQVFLKWFDFVDKFIQNQTDLIVYLRTTPEVAHDRIQKRQRHEEKSVPFEYISRLHDLHEAWLLNKWPSTTKNKIPVFTIDADLPAETIHTEYERFKQFLLESPKFNIALEKK